MSTVNIDGRSFTIEHDRATDEWHIYEPAAEHPQLATIRNGSIVNMDQRGVQSETRSLVRRIAGQAGIPLTPPKP